MAPSRSVGGSVPDAGPGRPLPRLVRRASGPPTRRPAREAFSTPLQRFAVASAAASARRACFSSRSSLTSLPVSIPTGQASWQEPSAAQVSSESYSYSSSSASLHRRARRLARHLAAQDDPLARRRRQVAARADRLAETALDAGRCRLLDLRRRFEVAQVDVGVAVEDDAGVEHAVGVGELLDPPHQLRRRLPPLALYIRGHVDAGAVLGLERAVVLADDQLDQLRHEGLVAIEVLLLGEVRGQHEVQVAGRGVAGNAGQEAVLAEQRLQVAGALGDPLRRHADVLDDQRRAGQAQAADQAVQALAHAPGQRDPLGLAGEIDRPDRLVAGEDLGRLGERRRRAPHRSRRRTRPAAPPTRVAAPSTPPERRPCSRRR